MTNGLLRSIPASVIDPLNRFDYFSNRLKLEYLSACLARRFDPAVLAELHSYYGREVTLAGGMNEAFRWFLGNPDVEWVEPLPTGEPFIETLPLRKGSGRLFTDFDPRSLETCLQLEAACAELLSAFRAVPSLETKIAIMTEFFAIKVTCHDAFIHGRGTQPARGLFDMPFVHIDPPREIEYITAVLDSPPSDFRLKNILSYSMASGLDPLACLVGDVPYSHKDRRVFINLVKNLLERIDQIDAASFFRWDIYGICNFIEGPVFLRRSHDRRCVSVLAESWENYNWDSGATCTQASDFLAREAFSILFDHSDVIKSNTFEYFTVPANRESLLKKIEEARLSLDSIFEKVH
jgi:hypothetical protein